MNAMLCSGCPIIIPTSSVCDALLFAIPKTRSSMVTVFDSKTYVLPVNDKLPVNSAFAAFITYVSSFATYTGERISLPVPFSIMGI